MQGYNFTEGVRRVLQLAREHAGRLGNEYVSPDHILLGIVSAGDDVAAAAVIVLGMELPALGAALEARMDRGGQTSDSLDLPYTARGKRVLECAMSEARGLKHSYVGTEHLLLGVLREGHSAAATVLMERGLSAERVRAEVVRLLGTDSSQGPTGHAPSAPAGLPFPRG
ncbi:MAG: Clp protease N-terminal domain-containing protein [Gemmatimonadales bacterium]